MGADKSDIIEIKDDYDEPVADKSTEETPKASSVADGSETGKSEVKSDKVEEPGDAATPQPTEPTENPEEKSKPPTPAPEENTEEQMDTVEEIAEKPEQAAEQKDAPPSATASETPVDASTEEMKEEEVE